MARFGHLVAESLFVDCSWTDSLARCSRRFVPILGWLMLCGLERCFPEPLIRQIYPSLPICVLSRVFDFENVGHRESTLRNQYVAEALRHPFLQVLIGAAVRAVEVPPHFDTNRKSASNEVIRPG
jgi:hypothetical protein